MRPATAQQTFFFPLSTSPRLLATANSQQGGGGYPVCFRHFRRLFFLASSACGTRPHLGEGTRNIPHYNPPNVWGLTGLETGRAGNECVAAPVPERWVSLCVYAGYLLHGFGTGVARDWSTKKNALCVDKRRKRMKRRSVTY